MTLGGRSIATGAVAVFGLLSLCVVLLAPEWEYTLEAIPAIVLAGLIFLQFRAARYSPVTAAAIVAALFAQPDLLATLARLDGPVWLSLVLYAIVASGAEGLVHVGVRSIIVLGGSLALLQIIDPIGVFLVSAIAPLLVVQPRLRRNSMQAVALAVLVLFVPVVTTVLLNQLGASHFAMSPLRALLIDLGLVSSYPTGAPSPFAPLAALVLIVPSLVLLAVNRSLRSTPAVFSAMLGLTVIVAFAASSYLGDRRECYWLAAALLPVVAVLLSTLRQTAQRERFVLASSFLSLAGSWIVWAL